MRSHAYSDHATKPDRRRYKGGGGGNKGAKRAEQKAKKAAKQAKKDAQRQQKQQNSLFAQLQAQLNAPPPPAPEFNFPDFGSPPQPPDPPPPATRTDQEVSQAGADIRRQRQRRAGFFKSFGSAGDSGGYTAKTTLG